MKYILDTNIFITAELEWYKQAFHLGGFWKYLEEGILSGHIVLCDAVYDELMEKNDVISKWLSSRNFNPTTCKNDPQIIINYGTISNYVMTEVERWNPDKRKSNNKKDKRRNFLNGADPWLVALAMTDTSNYAIITMEKADTEDNCLSPKIPNVCDHFKCESFGLSKLFDEYKPKFVLDNHPFQTR